MNVIEITNKFPTELDVVKFFERYRWRKKECPFCGSSRISTRAKDFRWHCLECRKSFSVTTNTYLHNTRLTLKQWLYAFSIVADAKKGLSALQLQRNCDISYPTAWRMYHTIRDLMSLENENIRLENIVEMDTKLITRDMRKYQGESKGTPYSIPELDRELKRYKGKFRFKEGKYKKPAKVGNQPRGTGASDLKVGGAVMRDGNVIAQVIARTSYKELKKIIDKHVNTNRNKTILLTDEAKENRKFKRVLNHIMIDHKRLYSYKGLNTNTIESFWAIVERQIKGQHHKVSLEYLPKYVAETVFKFNNRKNDDMFITLVRLSMKEREK